MIGLSIILIGILIRLISIRTIGNFKLSIENSEKIQTNGIYKYIRHPAYLGSMIIFIGLTIISVKASILFLTFTFFLSRAIEEEKILMNNQEYLDYIKKTGTFLPKIFGVK